MLWKNCSTPAADAADGDHPGMDGKNLPEHGRVREHSDRGPGCGRGRLMGQLAPGYALRELASQLTRTRTNYPEENETTELLGQSIRLDVSYSPSQWACIHCWRLFANRPSDRHSCKSNSILRLSQRPFLRGSNDEQTARFPHRYTPRQWERFDSGGR